MNPQEFLSKWRKVELKERSASQSHFNDLCHLLGLDDPIKADPTGQWFTFEKGATKTSGGEGWADVWRKGCFAWEYKGRAANLDKAYDQLLRYSIALESPPLLIVSDMERIRVHTNWTNTVQQIHEIALDDLVDAHNRDLLRACFEDPEKLRPSKTRQALTEQAAKEFASLAQRLGDRKHDTHSVAHFINRLVFCMFAEDIGLLPNNMFMRMLDASRSDPSKFGVHAATLFSAMKTGGTVGFERVEWFNGGLFDDDGTLPLEQADIDNLIAAARLDWSEIDPSILGTLFERGLDPDKREQLGAHYTDRDRIMQIINPVIVEPLTAEWSVAKAQIEIQMEKAATARARVPATQAEARKVYAAARRAEESAMRLATELHAKFIERLRGFRVLDPACGSGNFLYLSLLSLKDIEHRANLDAEALGLGRFAPSVGPENVLGIELNPYAAELARVSVWIGEIQWMRRNGFDASRNPVLRTLGNIQCRNALLRFDDIGERWVETDWPKTDVIVGNPPFLGGKSMKRALGSRETEAVRKVYGDRISAFSDMVCYWFEKSRDMIVSGKAVRAGLVSTKAIAKNVNLPVLVKLADDTIIFNAWQNEPWVVDGAAVRVSIICFEAKDGRSGPMLLNGQEVSHINPNLTSGLNTTTVAPLKENAGSAFIGVQQSGPLSVSRKLAEAWMALPTNPNGQRNAEILAPYVSTDDIVGRPTDEFLIDFPLGLDEAAASLFEAPYEYLRTATYDPQRDGKTVDFKTYRTSTAGQNPSWWEPHRSRPGMRAALHGVDTYLATAETTEHRVFRFLPASTVPDKSLYVFPKAGLVGFGILQSRFHEAWCTYFGNRIGAGNQRRYNAKFVYFTFPFPDGLTPDLPAEAYAADPRARAISAAAGRLHDLRENWLNPPDLAMRERNAVAGYPDRIVPTDENAAKELAKRTLTNLYNLRPQWLESAHLTLDQAVADAYGWGDKSRAGSLTDEEIIEGLFALNQERSENQ